MITREIEIMSGKDFFVSIKQNKKEAFNIIYKKYAASLLGIIQPIAKDNKLSETILQDVFLSFWSEIEISTNLNESIFQKLFIITRKIFDKKEYKIVKENTFDGEKSKEKQIIELIYKNGHTIDSASDLLKISKEEARKLLRESILNLRKNNK